MPAAAELRCTCGRIVIVFPSTLFGLVPEDVEPDFLDQLQRTETEDGKRFAVADDVGVWTCPRCGRSSIVPVVDFN
jgi:hypothetical protein